MLKNVPQNGFVLLDTNVLIDTSRYPEEFSDLHIELQELNISSVVESTIRFEFLRGLNNPNVGDELINSLCGQNHLELKPDTDIFISALKISRIFKRHDNKQVKIADILIASQISKYAREKAHVMELLLATQNHKDFPPVLFERVDDFLITLKDGSIKTIGFYRFRKDRFENLNDI